MFLELFVCLEYNSFGNRKLVSLKFDTIGSDAKLHTESSSLIKMHLCIKKRHVNGAALLMHWNTITLICVLRFVALAKYMFREKWLLGCNCMYHAIVYTLFHFNESRNEKEEKREPTLENNKNTKNCKQHEQQERENPKCNTRTYQKLNPRVFILFPYLISYIMFYFLVKK